MFEIGNSLREARLHRRVDFALAEQATKIRGKYLRALEEEHFELLPSQTYVKGFLRTYAEYLGLDGQLYVDEYNSRYVAGAGEELDLRPRRSSVRPQRRNRRFETNIVLVALAAIAIVTVVLISAWKSSGGKTPQTPTAAHKPVVAPRVPLRAPLLTLTAVRGDCQLSIHQGSAAGRLRYDGTLLRGTTRQFDAVRLWLNIASPENLVLKVRGHRVRLGGNRPRVIVVTRTGIHPAAA